ncbi:MAG TPA: GNAT family N-acetyltransferase [Thermoplasmata archaeon]|jgi:RimJ/RimL family protein N-acetyltransferase
MVRLDPMDAADFDPYMDRLIRAYAQDNVRAGRWNSQEGLAEARKEVQGLLPAGRETPNHFFFTIHSGPTEEKVGAIWFAVQPRGGFVYDLLVFEPFRRRGYAQEAMRLIEEVARQKGVQRLSLQVFGDNPGARRLYAKLGYTEMAMMMSKPLAP